MELSKSTSKLAFITPSTVFKKTKSSFALIPPSVTHIQQGKRSSEPDIKYATVTEWEAWKKNKIKSSLSKISRDETARYRNSFLHNLCIALLTAGFHKAFEEIFKLVENRRKARLKGGVDSVLWKRPLLEVEFRKLDALRRHLVKAETYQRKGNWERVYFCHHKLAVHFLQIEDFFLSDYFFNRALEVSLNIHLDGRRREAEALYYLGLASERNEDIESASRYMDNCYQLSVGRKWTNDDGEPLDLVACTRMSKLFSTLAAKKSDAESALKLYHRGLIIAKEGENPVEVARAALRLGWCYHEMKDNRMAMQYLKECFDMRETPGDEALLGDACRAMALSHYEQGNVERCLSYLKLFMDKFENSDNRREYFKACDALGTIHNNTGVYDKAEDALSSAYNELETLGRDEVALVKYGVAKGNLKLGSFMKNFKEPRPVMLSRISRWKEEGQDNYSQPPSEAHSRMAPSSVQSSSTSNDLTTRGSEEFHC